MANENAIQEPQAAQQTDQSQADQQPTGQTEQVVTQEPAAGAQPDPDARIAELQAELSKVQSEHTKASQRAAEAERMLEAVRPYAEQSFAQAPERAEQDLGLTEEDETTYVSRAEHKKAMHQFVTQIRSELRQTQLEQNLRQQYPDVADKGPKEKLLEHYAFNRIGELSQADRRNPVKVQQALDKAAKDTRDYIASLQQVGEQRVKQEQAQQQSKQKQAASAAASGLSSPGITAPSPAPTVPTQEQEYQTLKTEQQRTRSLGV